MKVDPAGLSFCVSLLLSQVSAASRERRRREQDAKSKWLQGCKSRMQREHEEQSWDSQQNTGPAVLLGLSRQSLFAAARAHREIHGAEHSIELSELRRQVAAALKDNEFALERLVGFEQEKEEEVAALEFKLAFTTPVKQSSLGTV